MTNADVLVEAKKIGDKYYILGCRVRQLIDGCQQGQHIQAVTAAEQADVILGEMRKEMQNLFGLESK